MPRIVDIHGQPIQTGKLKEPQTARAAAHRPTADYLVRGLTPAHLNTLLQNADQGQLGAVADLYEEMEERDGHISAEMSKRKRAVASLDYSIEAPRNADASEKNNTAWLSEVIQDIPDLEDVLLDMADAIGKGYALSEITWHRVQDVWLPRVIEQRPQNWFMTPVTNRNELRLIDVSGQGEPLRPFTWICHTHRAKSGYIARGALHRMLVWPFIFKNFAVRDLMEFLEIFGIPIRVGKYPAGATLEERNSLLSALVQMGHNAAGIMPDEMSVDFEEAASGSADAFMTMIDFCERTESKLILGATLTSQADRGSNTHALGNVHNDVRLDLRNSDAKQLQATLKRDLIYPMLVLNGRAPGNARRLPSLKFDIQQPEDLKAYADALPKLARGGMRIPQAWAHSKLRIPMPENDEAILNPPTHDAEDDASRDEDSPAPTSRAGTVRRSDGCPVHVTALSDPRRKADVPEPDALDALAQLGMAEWEPAMTRMLAPLMAELDAAIDGGQSLEQFREKLAALTSAMSVDALATPLARAAFMAGLMGDAGAET